MRPGAALLHAIAFLLMAVPGHAADAMNAHIDSTGFVTADGVRLNVLEAGMDNDGPVIAFVPGWSIPASIFTPQLEHLGNTHRVAALDPRGQGESEVPPAGYDIRQRAKDVREFVAQYDHVVLVGWSLGALEALEFVGERGDAALDGLVLVDSSVGEDPPPPPGTDFIAALKHDRRATLARFMRGIFAKPHSEAEIDVLVTAALRMPLSASLDLFPRAIPREHWRTIARAVSRPLYYIVTPQFAAQAEALARHRPGTRVAMFEHAGHALFVDEPERFNRLLDAFVRGLGKNRD